MSRIEIKIAGFGGQGIVTLGRLILYAAHFAGKQATEVIAYGGEARGGSSWADVVVDDEEVDHPRTSVPDILILFSQEGALTFAGRVGDRGIVLYDPVTIRQLSTKDTAQVFAIPATSIARSELNSPLVANTVMFGAFVGLTGMLPEASAEKGVEEGVPARALDLNLQAYKKGLEVARSLRSK